MKIIKYNPEIHHRQSIRLRGYDYSRPGAYFITICVKNHEMLFGDIDHGGDVFMDNDHLDNGCTGVRPDARTMQLNEFGQIAHNEWIKSAEIRSEIELGPFVVMPNHIHGIVILKNDMNRDNDDGRPYGNERPNGNGCTNGPQTKIHRRIRRRIQIIRHQTNQYFTKIARGTGLATQLL